MKGKKQHKKKLTLEKLNITKLDDNANKVVGGSFIILVDTNDNDGGNTTVNTSIINDPPIYTVP